MSSHPTSHTQFHERFRRRQQQQQQIQQIQQDQDQDRDQDQQQVPRISVTLPDLGAPLSSRGQASASAQSQAQTYEHEQNSTANSIQARAHAQSEARTQTRVSVPVPTPAHFPKLANPISPPPAYIRSPPAPIASMQFGSMQEGPTLRQGQGQGQGHQQPRPVSMRSVRRSGSSGSSRTAVEAGPSTQPKIERDTPQPDPKQPQTYQEWYPGDASHNGRPAWWNRVFCCGYGLGCLLCPCGSWTCKQERS